MKKALDNINSFLVIDSIGQRLTRILVHGESCFKGFLKHLVLRPLLFNIYLNNLFCLTESTEVCNFADDTTFFACDKYLNSLIKWLEHDSLLAIEWFQNNNMKSNENKCHLLVSGYKRENVWVHTGDERIWESTKQKLLGLQIDRNLNFNMRLHYAKKLAKNSQSLRDYQL